MVNRTGKAIGEEKFGELATVGAYAKYIFGASVNIGRENFGEYSLRFVKFTNFSLAKYFLPDL